MGRLQDSPDLSHGLAVIVSYIKLLSSPSIWSVRQRFFYPEAEYRVRRYSLLSFPAQLDLSRLASNFIIGSILFHLSNDQSQLVRAILWLERRMVDVLGHCGLCHRYDAFWV